LIRQTRALILASICVGVAAIGIFALMTTNQPPPAPAGTEIQSLRWDFTKGHHIAIVGWDASDSSTTLITRRATRKLWIRLPDSTEFSCDVETLQHRREGVALTSISLGFADEPLDDAIARAMSWADQLRILDTSKLVEWRAARQRQHRSIDAVNAIRIGRTFHAYGIGLEIRPSYIGMDHWHLTLTVGFVPTESPVVAKPATTAPAEVLRRQERATD